MIQEPFKSKFYPEFQGQEKPIISEESSTSSTLSTEINKNHQNSTNYFKNLQLRDPPTSESRG